MSEDRIDSRRGHVYFKFNCFFLLKELFLCVCRLCLQNTASPPCKLLFTLVISKRCQTGV